MAQFASEVSSQEGRRGIGPGAKLAGNGGSSPRENHRLARAATQSGKIIGTSLGRERGSLAGSNTPKCSSQNTKNTSDALHPLTRNDVIDFTQRLALRQPVALAAHEQNATPRAVESQRNGESSVSTLNLINWARANARVRAEVARMIGLSGAVTDPDFMEAAELMASYAARRLVPHPNDQHGVDYSDGEEAEEPSAIGDLFGGNGGSPSSGGEYGE